MYYVNPFYAAVIKIILTVLQARKFNVEGPTSGKDRLVESAHSGKGKSKYIIDEETEETLFHNKC